MPTVKLSSVDDFCVELKRDEGDLHRRIVRLCDRVEQSRISSNRRTLTIVASYAVQNAQGRIRDIVRLEEYCGDGWVSLGVWEKHVTDKAELARHKIKTQCAALGLEIRPGILD